MPIEIWLAFATASSILLVIPGPTILTVIGYAVSHGRKVNALLVVAVVLGDATALGLSILGLGPILAASSFWFTVVKSAGGLYLLYLGIRLIRGGFSPAELDQKQITGSNRNVFLNTFLVTALNPKGIVFFIAFLPQFVSPSYDVTTQLWILALTFVSLAALNTTMYAVFASGARTLLMSQAARRRFNLAGGTLLSVAGLWALLSRR